ncbi:MAG TPA: TMCO1/EMC3 family protein [Candidatus Diapherotrites archaeon]|uniref:TMCO1/EMC3 family protein n=1 Tax=Candidatus Iainarchaeum sp. TaxID=3101447 RepID=A0A7J4IY20_9ARCH|nr:TMCO1/EMC3 family protein [Candidatus Diapherotrites archaeon]
MVFGPLVDIALITAVLAVVSQLVQNKFMNKDEMKTRQEEMKEKQKRMKELMQKGDQKSKNELDALEKEMMESLQAMMSSSTKVMVASMVIFLPAFFVLGALFENAVIQLPIPLPWLKQGFDLFNAGTWGIEVYNETTWFGWYFVSYLVITMVINVGRNFFKKKGQKAIVNG